MSQRNFTLFLFYPGFPFIIEALQLSGEAGLGLCLFIYIATDAVYTFNVELDLVQKCIAFSNRVYLKVSGFDLNLPEITHSYPLLNHSLRTG